MTKETEHLFDFENLRRAFYEHYENYTPVVPWEKEQPFCDMLNEEQRNQFDQYVTIYNEADGEFMKTLYACGIKDGIRLGKLLKELDKKSGGPL